MIVIISEIIKWIINKNEYCGILCIYRKFVDTNAEV